MDRETILWGAGGTTVIIIVFLSAWFFWLGRRTGSVTGSKIAALLKTARTVIKANPKGWEPNGFVDRQKEIGTLLFIASDCSVRGKFRVNEASAFLSLEIGDLVLEMRFHEGILISMKLDQEAMGKEHTDVRNCATIARAVLDDVRRAAGFFVYEELPDEKPKKIYSRKCEADKKAAADKKEERERRKRK